MSKRIRAAQLIVAGTPGKVAIFLAIASLSYVVPGDPFYLGARTLIDQAVQAVAAPPREYGGPRPLEYMARVVMLEPGPWLGEGAVVPDLLGDATVQDLHEWRSEMVDPKRAAGWTLTVKPANDTIAVAVLRSGPNEVHERVALLGWAAGGACGAHVDRRGAGFEGADPAPRRAGWPAERLGYRGRRGFLLVVADNLSSLVPGNNPIALTNEDVSVVVASVPGVCWLIQVSLRDVLQSIAFHFDPLIALQPNLVAWHRPSYDDVDLLRDADVLHHTAGLFRPLEAC